MATVVLKSEARTETGSSACTRLRHAGHIPAVLYGRNIANLLLAVDLHDLNAAIASGARMLDLDTPAGTEKVFIREVQYDSMGSLPVHVDFTRVVMTEKITLEVSVTLVGRAPGVTEGGILDQPIKELEVECLPDRIPETIRCNVGSMKIGDMITVGQLEIPEGVTVHKDASLVIVTIHPPVTEEEAVAVAEPTEGAVEPEVIGAKEREAAAAAEEAEAGESGGKKEKKEKESKKE